MKIVITGALGHIGSKLIRILQQRFNPVKIVMVDDLSTQRYSSLFNLPNEGEYIFLEGKVSTMDWENILVSADVVVHLAALTDAAGTADKAQMVHDNNFESTKYLAEACLKACVPLIFPSSTSVYGSQSEWVNEDCQELKPQSPYADCKIKEERYLQELFKLGLTGNICRLGTIYGTSPGMRFHTAVNKFCWQAVMKQPITVWETAINQKRPYLSLEDACNAIIWLIQQRLYMGEIFNVVTNNFTVKEVLDVIQQFVSNIDLRFVQHKIMNQLSYKVCAKKIKDLGFNFEGNLEKGIEETVHLLTKASSLEA